MDIRVLLIEVIHLGNLFPGGREEFEEFLDNVGYKFYMNLSIDNIYVRKDFQMPKNVQKTKP